MGAAMLGSSQPTPHLPGSAILQQAAFPGPPQPSNGALPSLDTPTLRSVLHSLELPVQPPPVT